MFWKARKKLDRSILTRKLHRIVCKLYRWLNFENIVFAVINNFWPWTSLVCCSAAFNFFSPRRIFHSATLWRETLILKRCDRWRELFFQKRIKMCLWLPPGRISHATKTGRDTRGASPFGSQKTRVGDVDASAQDESNAKTPVQKFKNRRLKIRKDSRSRFRLRVPYRPGSQIRSDRF